MTDLAAEWPLSAWQSVRVEVNQSHNASNKHPYDNSLQQWSITLPTEW